MSLASLALDLARYGQPALDAPDAYPRRRPLLARGRLRRARAVPPDAVVLVRHGERVAAADPVAELRVTGRATAVDVAGPLGIAPDRLASVLVLEAGAMVADGDALAERRVLAGLQRRTLRSPATGRLTHVSTEHGFVLLEPLPAEARVAAHLAGTVVEIGAAGVVVEGHALAVAGIAGAGPAAAGALLVAESPEAVPDQLTGAVLACSFAVDEATIRRVADGGAAALVAAGIDGAAIERLAWEEVLWPPARDGGRLSAAAPPITLVLLGMGSVTPAPGVWDALRPLVGRPVSAVGAEPGCAPELLVELDENVASLYGLPPAGSDQVAPWLTPGGRVRVIAGRAAGLIGEVVAVDAGPSLLPSELRLDAADVAFDHGVRLRVPLLHLQPVG